MKATIAETYAFLTVLKPLAKESLDPIVAYKFFKFIKSCEAVYTETEEFLKDFRYDSRGLDEKQIQGKEEKFQKAWGEISTKEVELYDLKFNISELTGAKISLLFMTTFEKLIEE